MKKKISVLLALVLALSLALVGCGGSGVDRQTTNDANTTVESDSSDSNMLDIESDGKPDQEETYLDEETNILYSFDDTANVQISFTMPDGWEYLGGFHIPGGFINVHPPTDDGRAEGAFTLMQYGSDEGGQAAYDSMNKTGKLGESHEVTFGDNTYISNVAPDEDGATYYFCKEQSSIVIYLVAVSESDKTAVELVLSTLTY